MKHLKVLIFSVFFSLMVGSPCFVFAVNITETKASIGKGCNADGNYSTAMGYYTAATGDYSTAMGYYTAATGESSTAMGGHTTAGGYASVAMGYLTRAREDHSIAIGYSVIANAEKAIVIGSGFNDVSEFYNSIPSSFMVAYKTDESDTVPEFFVKRERVGVNTANPSATLHVKKNISGGASSANHVAVIENTSIESSPDVLMLKLNIDNPTTASNFITFSGNTGNLGSIEGNGSGGIVLNTSGGDFAEYLQKANTDEELKPGDIVGLFSEGVSKKTQNAQRLMVVTTAPAVLGNRPTENGESAYCPVAFLGQVPVKVEGTFSAGDFIIPSGKADGIGIAVSPKAIMASQYASVIGRTLTSNLAKGVNEATVLVGLPQSELWNGIINVRNARIAKLENRLAALESKNNKSFDIGFLPGAGILMGSLGFLWVERRRKRS